MDTGPQLEETGNYHVNQPVEGPNESGRRYALALCDRVESFDRNPLHSAAYLAYLAKYLKAPFQPRRRQHAIVRPVVPPPRPFVIQYLLQQGTTPKIQPFNDAHKFADLPTLPSQNELLFLTGRPSAAWLNCIGSRYFLDHRFFHQHLGPIISGQGQWNSGTTPDLPSRSLQVISLRIPTVIIVGSQGRNLDIRDLEIAREKCNAQLRRAWQSVQDSAASEAGRSIIRKLDIYDGCTVVAEQQLTGTIVHRGDSWTIILWNDAGNETDDTFIPIPSTKDFELVASELKFCPVFFENEFLLERQPSKPQDQTPNISSKQPLSLLNHDYGVTLDWSNIASTNSPLSVLKELFDFQAASALQFLNTLERILFELSNGCDFPSYEHTKLETTVQYDYIKTSLSRFEQHCSDIITFLDNPPAKWNNPHNNTHPHVQTETLIDFTYLISRARTLLKTCEDGKATLMSNDSVQKAKRSAKESELVTQLTKTTTRLGYIFLPISFVTSAFGMNFSELGQGPLSIWIWAAITVPMLIVCVLIVERDEWMGSKWKGLRLRRRNKSGFEGGEKI